MDELVNYVTESPENTNPNVVRSLASQMTTGGSSGVFIVYANEGVLDRTLREIQQAVATSPVIIHSVTDASREEDLMLIIKDYIVNEVRSGEGGYRVDAQNMDGYYKTSNLDDYPIYEAPK